LHQSSPSTMSRLRASSGPFPPGLDLRNQYRTLSSQSNDQGLSTPRSGSFVNPFTGGYASAPLTAPVDFSLPRTPDPGQRGFNIPQLSAPIAPPQDFSNAYNASLGPNTGEQGEREYGNQGQISGEPGIQGRGQVAEQPQQHHQHTRSNEEASCMRPVKYETEQNRKRSFTMSGQFESP
jgi:hypothetical protein